MENFLIDNRQVWTSTEWDMIRMKWFDLEERYQKAIKKELTKLKKENQRLKQESFDWSMAYDCLKADIGQVKRDYYKKGYHDALNGRPFKP